ncbi:BTB/POZ and MATH domain-containing protein 2-like [Lolium rigidum]|uniref:BTB/POZ and MATH domain-containing protein 2-like n=1 Tax=Lolium rigidum TaxID=89674 RepID=UPI001F5DF808|nr:BTB/POZ and MATH domain-containing protein 2-like [Lolium rigidum]
MATNLTEAARAVRQLRIDGYSATTAMGEEDSIKSTWSVDGYEWEVSVYPARVRVPMDQVPWVAAALNLLSQGRTNVVRANLAARLIDRRGSLPASEQKSQARTFSGRKGFSSPVFVFLLPSRDLPASGYLWNDTLTVECTITVLKDMSVPTVPVSQVLPMPSSNLHQHLAELLRAGTGADVTFVVAGEAFPAHKAILAARSPVLMAEFFGHMRETSSGRVQVRGVAPAAFKAMLHFVYTDTVPELDQEVKTVVTSWAQHLLAAADRYGLDRLKLICEIKLSTGITVDTAAATLVLAEKHSCSHLKAKCVEFIVSTPAILDAVVATEGYRQLEASCPAAVTSIVISMRGRRN